MASIIIPGRRAFLGSIGAAAAFFHTKALFAEELTLTADATEGPFYPDKMPLDTDNDLLIINDSITPAVGEVAWVTGRVLTASGQPVRNAFVEIWQCDARESYIHTQGRSKQLDANFQGYGRYLTDSSGNYLFRTIKPISYTLQGMFRAPHIHVAVSRNGKRLITSQIAVRGHQDNLKDPVWKMLKEKDRETTLTDFVPMPGSRIGELTAKFDVVLGRTAMEGDDGVMRGGIGKSTWKGMPRKR